MKPVIKFKDTVSKAGNSSTENEDSWYEVSDNPSSQVYGTYYYAVSDGATESSFAKEWARMLAQTYCQGRLCDKDVFTNYLQTIQKRWQQKIESKESFLPWYALEKAQSGAFSSLVGLRIYNQGTWETIAVGDSCLFQIRQNQLITKFPIENSKEFNNRPFLISSLNSKNSQLAQNTKFFEDKWEIGDSFYLMTDALSCWFLEEYEKGNSPWLILNNKDFDCLSDKLRKHEKYEGDFKEKINSLRLNKQIRNDDVTLIIITLES
jgi:hypothetical protein